MRASVSLNFKDLCGINNTSDENQLSSNRRERKSSLLVSTITQLKTLQPLMLIQRESYIILLLGQLLQRRWRKILLMSSMLKTVNNQVLQWKVERSERFILRHLTQATTEDIFYIRKFLEINPKSKTLTSFKAQHNLFEASYRKQDKSRRFKRCTFLGTFGSTSLNFLFRWSAKKINKEQAATWIGSTKVFNLNCRLSSEFCNHLKFHDKYPVNNT